MTFQTPSRKLIIYQMMTRLFGNKMTANKWFGTLDENGCGKFNDITSAALEGIRALGVSHVWYTGVIRHALLTDYREWGIAPDAAEIVKGRAGSPYAIKDYYDVNPDLAGDVGNRFQEFEALVSRTHTYGLKVIIDFVPNHVARAYKSLTRPGGVKELGEGDVTTVVFHPDNNFYYLPGETFHPPADYKPLGGMALPGVAPYSESPAKVTGNDEFNASPGISSWFETVKLNYGIDILNHRSTHFNPVPDTWMKMRDILLFWASKGVDGFRCDMAEMVPVEFWEWVIPHVKQIHPGLVFIAEIYNPHQYRNYIERGRFDYLYDKVLLYDTLRLLINGQKSASDIAHIQADLAGIHQHMLHFLENHDEQRIASPQFAGDPWRAIPAMVVSATLDAGPVMVYFGQEVGEPGAGSEGFQGDDGRTTIFDYWGVPEHQKWMNGGRFDGGRLSEEQKRLRDFYARLLSVASHQKAFSQGTYLDLTVFNATAGNFAPPICAFLRYTDEERILIVANFSDRQEDILIQIPAAQLQQLNFVPGPFVGRELLTGQNNINMDFQKGVSLQMIPYGCCIFDIKKGP